MNSHIGKEIVLLNENILEVINNNQEKTFPYTGKILFL